VKVVEVVDNQKYGKLVAIRHNNGFTSYSIHLDTTKVKEGDKVKSGTNEPLRGKRANEFAARYLVGIDIIYVVRSGKEII
jgi:hypothetical protein